MLRIRSVLGIYYYCIIYIFLMSEECIAYKKGDKVILYVNKVGPYYNPQETYHYYELPVCRPKIVEHKSLTLGEVLDGDRMAKSLYDITFLKSDANHVLCDLVLSESEIKYLQESIEENYYFEFVVDGLSLRNYIGHFKESGYLPHTHKIYLWTHHHFNFYYNNDKIIYVNISEEHKPLSLNDVSPPLKIKPTYSVTWIPTSVTYDLRFSIAAASQVFFPGRMEVHWLSILNSVLLVMILITIVVVILTRILKKDFDRYNVEEGNIDESMLSDDSGWKNVHTDVFRIPPHCGLLSAILGVGSQLTCVCLGLLAMSAFGLFNVHWHGAANAAAVVLYALTSVVSGYVSATFYRKTGGQKWVKNVNVTTLLFAAPFSFIWSLQNSVAWIYQSTQALPATTAILLLLLWLLVGYPLTVLGAIFGRRADPSLNFPCRARKIPREIPVTPFYKGPIAHILIGGFLPFGSISVEIYYIFTALWGREQYTLFGMGLVSSAVCLNLTCVSAALSIALTFFSLVREDYRWWWRSVLNLGSTGFFLAIYSCFFYAYRSNMSGLLQAVEFFGWAFLMAYCFFLSLGTISFFSSLVFVRYIYSNVKID